MLDGFDRSPFAVSGMVSCPPLAAAEAAEATGLPILSREDLRSPETIELHVVPCIHQATQENYAA